ATPTKSAAPAARTTNRPDWLRTTLELVVYGVVAIVFLEWFFGFCGVGEQEFLQPDKELGLRHIPGKLVTWRLEGFSRDHFTGSGLRDVEHSVIKPPGVTRIALLGDSSTDGLQVPLADTYART